MTETLLRQHAMLILKAALQAVSPQVVIPRFLQRTGSLVQAGDSVIDLAQYRNINVVGAGKAGAAMARALEQVLGDKLSGGLVVVKQEHVLATDKIKIIEAGHPVPDERSVAAGEKISSFVRAHKGPGNLFFFLLSGGASSLLVAPAPGISLEDKQEMTRLLLASGANIDEINTIRKHLSLIKGGGLARLARPSRIISLIISDVVGDDPALIGSGPTVRDKSTWRRCLDILAHRNLLIETPPNVRARFEKGAGEEASGATELSEEPDNAENHLIASNFPALRAAAEAARDLGYTPLILGASIEGETRDIASMHAAITREIITTNNPLPPPCCVISGGETTVNLGASKGKGGRNQEFALAAATKLRDIANVLLLSAGTDGTDGPTDAAGALVTGSTLERAEKLELSTEKSLLKHDAYPFFQALDDLIISGPTMTNVMDIHVILVGKNH